MSIVTSEPASDATLVVNCPTALVDRADVAKAVAASFAPSAGPPMLAAWLGSDASSQAHRLLSDEAVPVFDSTTQAVRAFCHLVAFRRNQTLLLETPTAGVTLTRSAVASATELIGKVRREGRTLLNEYEAKQLLALAGVPTVATRIAATPKEAGQLADEIGGRIALKILTETISHKSDVGGVSLGLSSGAEVEREAVAMLARVKAARPDVQNLRFTVQAFVERRGAIELLLGVARDATFGPVIVFGQGGTATEVLADRCIGLPPLNTVLARDMIGRTRVARLMAGFRNVPPVRPGAVDDVLLRLAEIVVRLPDVIELDINPLLADSDGVLALDARIVISDTPALDHELSIMPYPAKLERTIALRDGVELAIRPIRPDDEVELAAMVARCTPEDRRLRFLGPLKVLNHELAARLSQIDYDREMAFVALEPASEAETAPICGVVRIIGDPERDVAEFAVLVRSDMKDRGLGYRLLSEIIA